MHFALENPDMLKALIVADISMRTYNRRFRHLDMIDAMMNVGSGHYEGDHWLASFAIYMLYTANSVRSVLDY